MSKEEELNEQEELCEEEQNASSKNEEEEAKEAADRFAADPASRAYPTLFTPSDTSGEKPVEEFHAPGERVNLHRYSNVGVACFDPPTERERQVVRRLLTEVEELYGEKTWTKKQVKQILERAIPSLSHVELGRDLDQKM